MKILLISGSLPPEPCGVGDFTYTLYRKLMETSYPVQIIKKFHWGITSFRSINRVINQVAPDVIHIQYPTNGYKYSLLPQLLALLYPSIVTLHEFSHVNILRKLSMIFFTFRSILIFTNEDERDYFCKFYFWFNRSKTNIIPIGSSVNINLSLDENIPEKNIISYFGLIRPNKGLEDVIKLAVLLKESQSIFTVRIIGKTVPNLDNYTKYLYSLAKDLSIDWCLDLSDDILSKQLCESSFMYLPFPDGASMRRSSLFAALSNGIVTFTTKGNQTPSDMNKAVLYVESPEEVLSILTGNTSIADLKTHYKEQSIAYSSKFAWSYIIEKHIKLYGQYRV